MTNITYIHGNKDKGTYALPRLTGDLNPNSYLLVKRFGEADTSYKQIEFSKQGILLSERVCTKEEKKVCQDRIKTFNPKAVLENLGNGNDRYYLYGKNSRSYAPLEDLFATAYSEESLGKEVYIEVENAYDPEAEEAGRYSTDSFGSLRQASPGEIIAFKAATGDENMTSHLKREGEE